MKWRQAQGPGSGTVRLSMVREEPGRATENALLGRNIGHQKANTGGRPSMAKVSSTQRPVIEAPWSSLWAMNDRSRRQARSLQLKLPST